MCSLFLVLRTLNTTAVRSIKKKTHQCLLLWEVSVVQQRLSDGEGISGLDSCVVLLPVSGAVTGLAGLTHILRLPLAEHRLCNNRQLYLVFEF